MSDNIAELVDEFVKKIGLDKLHPYDTGKIDWALNLDDEVSDLSAAQLDAALIILANYRLLLAHQMGMTFARLRYLEDTYQPKSKVSGQRAKLNIIKPWHDAVEAKISVMKKIYDRKVREEYVTGSRR